MVDECSSSLEEFLCCVGSSSGGKHAKMLEGKGELPFGLTKTREQVLSLTMLGRVS